MIAASDPLEFVPRGRQQAQRHPGPLLSLPKRSADDNEDILLNKFEEVSLKENTENEWWLLREAPNDLHENKADEENENDVNEMGESFAPRFSISGIGEDSAKSTDLFSKKRGSDTFKYSKRYSMDSQSSRPQLKTGKTPLKVRTEIGCMEDELYIRGNTAVWSRGLTDNHNDLENGRKTICCYTTPFPIRHALWCTFYRKRPAYNTNFDVTDNDDGVPVSALCIIDFRNIRVFTESGEDYVTAIPFQINNIWNTKYGILMQRIVDDDPKLFNDNKACFYSLAYPLDEIAPVASYNVSQIQLWTNSNYKIVFTNEKPSICMLYDTQTKQHSVYRLRKLTSSDRLRYFEKADSSYQSSISHSNKLKSRMLLWESMKQSSNHLQLPHSFSGRPASVSNLQQSRSHSSIIMSRGQSPRLSINSPWLSRASRLNMTPHYADTTRNASFFDCSKAMTYVHASPQICLEHLWTDIYNNQEDNVGAAASKTFLCDDLTEQWYLCFILQSKCQLSMVKIDFTSNFSNITFGNVTNVGAKDAIAIPHLHMMAILEYSNNITLYSGLTVVGKLHIGGTLAQHTPSPFFKRNISQFTSPLPRRSSLLPHSKSSDPKFDEHILSPVLPEASGNAVLHFNFVFEGDRGNACLLKLENVIGNRMILKYSDRTYCRVTLPSLAASSLVESCINAIRCCLNRDAILTVISRWYALRNAPGTQDIDEEEEWRMFTTLLYDFLSFYFLYLQMTELFGYDDIHAVDSSDGPPSSTSSNPKRLKHSNSGSDDDWEYLINTEYNNRVGDTLLSILNLPSSKRIKNSNNKQSTNLNINTNAPLFAYIRVVHYVFHLFYEDLKFNLLRFEDQRRLGVFLNQLSCYLSLEDYAVHYWKDFPSFCHIHIKEHFNLNDLKNVIMWPIITKIPLNIMEYINDILLGKEIVPLPHLKGVNSKTMDIIQICTVISKKFMVPTKISVPINEIQPLSGDAVLKMVETTIETNIAESAVLLMVDKRLTVADLEILPPAINLLFYSVLWQCRESPPASWPSAAYYLLWRDDLARQLNCERKHLVDEDSKLFEAVKSSTDNEYDGMEELDSPLMRLRFSNDVRVREARKMLQSSRPVPIVCAQKPEVSDHDFIEEQEKQLYAISARTMALPVGRGMVTLGTSCPIMTEPLPAPQLCLTGRGVPRGATIELSHVDMPSNMNLWPLFHNGVANGLRIAQSADNIDNTWIIFNKPRASMDHQLEHAGFLMALGLNGHLKNLAVLSTYDYLIKLHEVTSIGVLLGLAATFRASCHPVLTKTLSIHIEGLLPPTSMELDVPQNLQVAALMGIGLVYQGSGHRRMIEVLLSEIGRPPGPEMENCIDRESYSLSAGLALGLVVLKHGEKVCGLADLNISDTLHYYMVGGNRRPLMGSQKDKYRVASFQIKEGSCVNLDVTAPGATIALGLMYLNSGNKAVAEWMAPPATQYLLDFVRPDLLMFRILSRSLILWDEVVASKTWVESQVPGTIRPYCLVTPVPNSDIDYEAMNQAYCNIVAGACFALGLKYAGSANENAFKTLLFYCKMFTELTTKSISELAGKPTIETCLSIILLSLATVMAGSGNLEVMRFVRYLRQRVGSVGSTFNANISVTYGTHMAIHMALGLLFLGGGRCTLSNSPENIAALICAFYPKFPTHSNDNRYHLQAFRHLYVLAVEPRILIPKTVKEICYATLKVVTLDGKEIEMKGPGIIPDPNILRRVAVEDERYWPVVFERKCNWDLLINILSTNGYIEVKQRAGCLSYTLDKYGFQSQLAKTLTESEIAPWDPSPLAIISFTSHPTIKSFCDEFLNKDGYFNNGYESKMKQIITKITYEAVVKDKLIIIPIFTAIFKMIKELQFFPNPRHLWQMKLLSSQILNVPLSANLISDETFFALKQEMITILDEWESDIESVFQYYLEPSNTVIDDVLLIKLAVYVTYYNLPKQRDYYNINNYLGKLHDLKNLYSSETVEKIFKLTGKIK